MGRDQNWIPWRGTRIGSQWEGPNRIIKQVGRWDKGKSVSNTDGIADFTGKNALRKESQDATVYQKETELDEKGRSAGAVMSCRRCIDHSQEWKVIYSSID